MPLEGLVSLTDLILKESKKCLNERQELLANEYLAFSILVLG